MTRSSLVGSLVAASALAAIMTLDTGIKTSAVPTAAIADTPASVSILISDGETTISRAVQFDIASDALTADSARALDSLARSLDGQPAAISIHPVLASPAPTVEDIQRTQMVIEELAARGVPSAAMTASLDEPMAPLVSLD